MNYKRIVMAVTATAIAAVFGVIIYLVTKQFQSMCASGMHYDETLKRCLETCSGQEINQPTLNYKCAACAKGMTLQNDKCKILCNDSADCPKGPTGEAVKCLNGTCLEEVWTCNKDPNGNGKVCTPQTGPIPAGYVPWSSRKECLLSGCTCDKNWELNAAMDSCNTFACTENALNGWGSNLKQGDKSKESTLFKPFTSPGGFCLPVTDDGTPDSPGEPCTATTKEECISTGEDENKLICRWFPNTVCNRIRPTAPWKNCMCQIPACYTCRASQPDNGYTASDCSMQGWGSGDCGVNLRPNDKIVSNCVRKYREAGGKGTGQCPTSAD